MSNNNKNNKNITFFWKKSLSPLCSFSISKCLPTIVANTNPPRHHLSSTSSSFSNSNDDDDQLCQTTNTSLSYNSSSIINYSLFADEEESSDQPIAEADFAAVFASQRFFFASPGSSNSIVDEPRNATLKKRHVVRRRRRRTASFDHHHEVEEVRKYSVDPRLDFRRSMQEMIEARNVENKGNDERSDLEYLHELLLCFLSLNPNDTHKFVISAFTDVVVDLLSSSSKEDDDNVRRCHGVKIQRKRDALRRLSM